MKQLQAGYFIDELRALLLKKGAKKEFINQIENGLSCFMLAGCNNISINHPLLAVAHKIISRGIPTRASIEVSDALLKKHFNDFYNGVIKNERPEIILDLMLKPNMELEFFKNTQVGFPLNTESLYSNNAKQIEFNIFNCLKDLNLIAKLQNAILFLLAANNSFENVFTLNVIGNSSHDILELAIADINKLFKHLNVLSEYKVQLPILLFNPESENEILISNDKNYYSNRGITLFAETDQSFDGYDNCFFTTQRIHYPNFEDTTEYRGAQEFKIVNEVKENALLYFLNNIFRKTDFYAGQKAIINRALQGYDVIGLLPTGGGKSLTYQFCSLLQPGFTIVIDPINSLMKDQHDKLVLNGINCSDFYNSLLDDKNEKQEILDQFENGKFLIFLISPERLQMQVFRNIVERLVSKNYHFSYAVIDEAHCVSEWGHDFRFPYLNLGENIRRFFTNNEQPSFFGLTATASFDVLSDVQRELGLESEEAIISLPPEAIDREELEFRIIDVGETCPEIDVHKAEYYTREKHMGEYKYPLIEKYISETVLKSIRQREKGKDSTRNFFNKGENGYENAGIIFCPTKSNKLSNGVLAVRDGYERGKKFIYGLKDSNKLKDKLTIGTFFGAGNDDGVIDKKIDEEAKNSFENQVKFLTNELNLMISTKAFGMGIDKPNIRYTLHYAFPSSVESFYQEAGRAGRNRQPALCSVLYHPSDELMNKDFVENGFKGVVREKETLLELLTEVRYEDEFFVSVLRNQLALKFSDVKDILFIEDSKTKKKRYLQIYGEYKKEKEDKIIYGKIDLWLNYRIYDNVIKNVEEQYALEVCGHCIDILKNETKGTDPCIWLQKKSTLGLLSLMNENNIDSQNLPIGFNNDVANNLVEYIKKEGFPDFDIQIINSAFNFSNTEEKFLENLKYYYKAKTGKIFDPNQLTKDKINNGFIKIRNGENTQRAVYRLITLGIIDDYTIDYAGRAIEVTFKKKTEKEYEKKFREYLRKYLGEERTEEWLAKVEKCEANTLLERYIWVLIEFVYDQIYNKRISAVGYMKDLCDENKVNISQYSSREEGEKMKEKIVLYFTSKYAGDLKNDLVDDKQKDSDTIQKYIGFIYFEKGDEKNPGTELNNAKHLRGACDRLLIEKTDKRPALFILHAFSLFALEYGGAITEEEILAKPMIKKAIEEYRMGFKKLVEKENWGTCKYLIETISKHVKNLNPPLVKPLNRLEKEFLMHYNLNKLKEVNKKFESELLDGLKEMNTKFSSESIEK